MSFFSSMFTTSLIDLITNRDSDKALERIANKQELDSHTWSDHLTPLHIAVSTEQQKIVVALIEAGAPVNAKTYYDWITPLHQAVMCGNVEAARVLAPRADLNAKTYKEENTALHIAIARGDVRMAQLLLEAGASVALKNAVGETALHLAARLNDATILRAVLAKNPDVDAANNKGETPLVLTAANKEARKALIEAGADLDKVFKRVAELQNQVKALSDENSRLVNEKASLNSQLLLAHSNQSVNNYSYNDLKRQLATMTKDRDYWRTQTRLALETIDVPMAFPVGIPVAEVVEVVQAVPVTDATYRPNPRY